MRLQMGIGNLNLLSYSFEVFFTLIIIFCSFLIYYKTKEYYNLSGHRGLKYFRRGFLFIFFAHLFKLISIFITSQFFLLISRRMLFELFGLFFFIGIGFLFSSMFSKQIKEYYIYLTTFIVFFLGLLFHTKFFMVFYSTILILSLGVVSVIKYKNKKQKKLSAIYIIYILIFLSWLFSILTRVFTTFPIHSKLINTTFTGVIFLVILFLVAKRLK